MTREEAIKILKEIIDTGWLISDIDKCTAIDACEMAIKALEQEPCTQEKQANADKIDAVYIDGFKAGYSQARFDLEQEPCEDCEDAVNRGLYEQTRWERDIAVKQLSDLGYQLGEKVRKCEDAISRQAVKQEFAEWHKGGYEDCAFYKYLDKMPPVSVAEKTGRWIEDDITFCGVDFTDYKCDQCGEIGETCRKGFKPDKLPKYCPNCGIKMVEPQERSDI